MNSLNKAQIIGNVTRDLVLKKTQSGQSVTTVGVATNRTWTDSGGMRHEEAEYHNVVCWGRLAEISCDFIRKGTKVFFEGRLRTRSWEDESGTKHYRTEIVAQDMIILTPKGGERASGGGDDYSGYDDNAPTPEYADGDFDTGANAATTSKKPNPEDLPF